MKVGNVRFTPESGHCLTAIAMSALCQKQTSCSATDCSLFDHFVGVGGQRLIASSNLVGSSTKFSYRTIASHMF